MKELLDYFGDSIPGELPSEVSENFLEKISEKEPERALRIFLIEVLENS